MTLIDFGDIKIRFDPKEVRINIDGELIDIGVQSDEYDNNTKIMLTWEGETESYTQQDIQRFFDKISNVKNNILGGNK